MVLRLIMLQAIQANISTPTAARLSWGACDPLADVFGPGGGKGAAQPTVDVKSLHAKIGELSLT